MEAVDISKIKLEYKDVADAGKQVPATILKNNLAKVRFYSII